MAGYGFVHEKLDIKFLILYIATRVIEPIPIEDMQELTMCDDGFDYFDFAECLAELVQTGHLTLEDGLYAITDKGIRNGNICESSLAYPVRVRADKNIAVFNQKLKRRNLVRAGVKQRDNGTYTVTLSFSDDIANLMTLELMVTDETQAKELCQRFKRDPQTIYGKLIQMLLYEGK